MKAGATHTRSQGNAAAGERTAQLLPRQPSAGASPVDTDSNPVSRTVRQFISVVQATNLCYFIISALEN